MSAVITTRYEEMPLCEADVLRYAGCRDTDAAVLDLLYTCFEELRGSLTYTVCHREFLVSVQGDRCDFGSFSLHSEALAAYLADCGQVVLFAATVGVAPDRLVAKYSRVSPAKALMMQAIGAERIEALCDRFCEDTVQRKGAPMISRFSPGYGDLPLEAQTEVFRVLDCAHKIGLCLNDSLLMSPTKSVTAFFGIKGKKDAL